jgi:hypothetical protein
MKIMYAVPDPPLEPSLPIYVCPPKLPHLVASHFGLAVTTGSAFAAAGELTSSVELAAPFCPWSGSWLFLHLKNMITTPAINANPSTPPTAPPITAPLFDFFAPLVLAPAVAEALCVPVGDFREEGREVLGAGVVANFATVVVSACPACPGKAVWAGRGSEVEI